jgi:stage V sporulation protein G
VHITEVRVKLMERRDDRLQAFCCVTIDDDFVVRDIKVIRGSKGLFVAMPSRKLSDKCPNCGGKNHLRARYCNNCGGTLDEDRAPRDQRGRAKLHADIAHPINSDCREELQREVLEAYEEELAEAKRPGYVPPRMYDGEDLESALDEFESSEDEDTRKSEKREFGEGLFNK